MAVDLEAAPPPRSMDVLLKSCDSAQSVPLQPPHQPSFGSTMMLERACRTSPNFVAKLSSPMADVQRATEPLCECIVCEQAACLVPQANQFITQVELLTRGVQKIFTHERVGHPLDNGDLEFDLVLEFDLDLEAYKQTLEGAAISGRSRLMLEL